MTYNFTVTGIPTGDPAGQTGAGFVTGNITLVGTVTDSIFTASSGSITFDASGITAGTETWSLTSPTAPGVTVESPGFYYSPSTYWIFDDVINPTEPDYLTMAGLLFQSGSQEMVLWYTGYTDAMASYDTNSLIQSPEAYDGYGIQLDINNVSTPEPSSLMLLGTGLLCMAGFLFWKAKPSMVRAK